jgi:hypothetical protein
LQHGRPCHGYHGACADLLVDVLVIHQVVIPLLVVNDQIMSPPPEWFWRVVSACATQGIAIRLCQGQVLTLWVPKESPGGQLVLCTSLQESNCNSSALWAWRGDRDTFLVGIGSVVVCSGRQVWNSTGGCVSDGAAVPVPCRHLAATKPSLGDTTVRLSAQPSDGVAQPFSVTITTCLLMLEGICGL